MVMTIITAAIIRAREITIKRMFSREGPPP